jgi:UDP-N-acetylmuramoylalanine--D-glutamate ligase
MLDLRDQHVLILGLGDSGLAMARWCAWCGAQVSVADTREQPPQAQALQADVPGAALHVGFRPELLDGKQRVLKSPGLSPEAADVAAMLGRARELNMPVQGELDLFAQALRDLRATRQYTPKVLAITGTNGKTTTTSLTALLVKRAGLRVGLAGNIGPTLLDTLREALLLEPEVAEEEVLAEEDVPAEEVPVLTVEEPLVEAPLVDEPLPDDESLTPVTLIQPPPALPVFTVLPDVWVLELSSFQLDGVQGFDPSASVVLNITQDHLDWHGSMAAYTQAKSRIYGPTSVMVVNRDEDEVMAMVPAPVQVKSAGRGRPATLVSRQVVRFGLNAPTHPGDFGLVHEGGMHWLVRAMEADPTIKLKAGDQHELVIQRLMPADALRIRGRHNASNALAALALATAVGVPLAPMLHALREYRGEPHRVESVTSIQGIDAIDDSKGTNVGATVAALLGLGPEVAPKKLVIILGGDGKGQDFGPLQQPISRYARAVACMGRDGAAIEQALHGTDRLVDAMGQAIAVSQHASLQDATRWAFQQAQPGDAVLLSPACASLDMFRNYAHRAEVFIDTVRELALENGELA